MVSAQLSEKAKLAFLLFKPESFRLFFKLLDRDLKVFKMRARDVH